MLRNPNTTSESSIDGSLLINAWNTPMDTRLMRKTFSMRMPLLLLAKINALCDLFPMMNRTAIICDLIATTLKDVEDKMPFEKGEEFVEDSMTGEPRFRFGGMKGKYFDLVAKHLREIEIQNGYENEPLPYGPFYAKEAFYESHEK